MKRLAILGSTGSIGRQTLDVVRAFPNKFEVVGLGAGRNVGLLAQQVSEFRPALVYCCPDEPNDWAPPDSTCQAVSLEEMAQHPDVDVVMVATVGKAGLVPTLAAIHAGKTVALANKEVMIMAGELITTEARRNGVAVLPVDSEPNAIWQCMRGEENDPARIIITASGGPFRKLPLEQMGQVNPEEALRHPTWSMGKKITIDSATLMNKGMEVIEAHWLFNIPYDRIEVVIHPQSLIHSMVEFADGSIKAQISHPDMRLPIQYTLSYPERWPNHTPPRLDLVRVGSFTFDSLDSDRYPCFRLAQEAGRRGSTYTAVLCGSDEVAVESFLSRKIGFLDIARLVEKALEQHNPIDEASLDEILQADAWARDFTKSQIKG